MRIMIDTNIFISAALFPKGRAAEALYKTLSSERWLFCCYTKMLASDGAGCI